MNSNFSKLEKSVEECVHYNFDNDINDQPAETNSNLTTNNDHKINGQVNVSVSSWLIFNDKYPWLYVNNDNPNCKYCEQAFQHEADIIETCWTSAESVLDNADLLLEKAKILKIHSKSVNHVAAYNFLLENSFIDCKNTAEKDKKSKPTKSDIPNFMTISEWEELTKLFPWLYFKENFRCQLCEDGFNKQRKSMFPTQWTCPDQFKQLGSPSQKSLRSASRFEKHQMSINHIKAIEVLKECSVPEETDVKPYVLCSAKENEQKRVKSPRKSVKFSPPNVTTRTAIKKSLQDRNEVVDIMSEDSWKKCQTDYPWIFCVKNVLRCSFCEEAYKDHSDTMISTVWTCPVDSAPEQNASQLQYMKSRFRLNRHENTKNHMAAISFMNRSKMGVNILPISATPAETEKKKEFCVSIAMTTPTDALILPAAVKASRKSAPVKLVNLSYDEKPMSPENSAERVQNFLQSQRQMGLKTNKTEVMEENYQSDGVNGPAPPFLTQDQYDRLKSRYLWFFAEQDNSYGCTTCLEAFKLSPKTMLETQFTNGVEKFDPSSTYSYFRKKLYRHSESINHGNARNIIRNKGRNNYQNTIVQKTTSQSPVGNSRFTRLKSGSRCKIDYKLMSEGYTDREDWKHFTSNRNNIVNIPTPMKKRRELSNDWKCPQCKSHFSNANDLIQHISLCDYQPSDSTKMLACPCNPIGCRFNTITKLDLHAAQEHDNHSYFHCYICSDRYNRLSSLFHHMLINHLISWNPFDAYLPTGPSEPFLCMFCNCSHNTKISLVDHYCHSDCSKNLQPIIVLEDMMSLSAVMSNSMITHVQEEIDVFDVDELPEDKEVVYSPINKKCRTHHTRIRRGHSMRKFGDGKKSIVKAKEIKNATESGQGGNKSDKRNLNDSSKTNISIIDKSVDDSKTCEQKLNIDTSTITQEVSVSKFLNEIDFVQAVNDEKVSIKTDGKNDKTSDIMVKEQPENFVKTKRSSENNEKSILVFETNSQTTKENQINESIVGTKSHESISIGTDIDLKSNKTTEETSINNTIMENNIFQLNETINAQIDQLVAVTLSGKPVEKVRRRRMSKKMKQLINELNCEESKMVKVLKRKYVKKFDKSSQPSMKKTKTSDISTPQNKEIKQTWIKKTSSEMEAIDQNMFSADVNSVTSKSATSSEILRQKKIAIRIQSQCSPCKKLKTIDRSENDIPTGISFMDRMKKIRQLKKTRTEQQREEMMAVERKIAEIIEKSHDRSLIDKSDKIRKLLNSERCSLDDLKTIIRKESKKRRAEKRRTSNHSNSIHVQSEPTKFPKVIEFSNKPVVISSPSVTPVVGTGSALPKRLEIFSCNVCHLKFKSLRARDNHTTTDHKGLKLFCCKSCHLSFTTHILLRKHAQKYHVDNVSFAVFGKQQTAEIDFSFSCVLCPLQFTSRSGLNHHITSSHKTVVDSEMAATALLDELLVKLIAADSTFCPQICLICQETMNNQFELEIHTIEHQKESKIIGSESIQFACPKCCRLFFGRDGKSYLKDHYNIIHLEKQPPTCEDCDSKFSSTVCYSLHRKLSKNCSKKGGGGCADHLKIEDPYEKLNDPMKLAFICSRCQTLVAGESAESRFHQHQVECNKTLGEDLLRSISHTEAEDKH